MPTLQEKKIEKLADKVSEVIQEQKQMLKNERIILEKVSITETQGKDIEEDVEEDVESTEKMTAFQESLLGRVKNHRFIFPLFVALGVVLVWRGLWDILDQVPIISYSLVSLTLGLVILWAFNRMKSL